MSDVRCIICGEPWDHYGVKHGDMLEWESKLFLAGAGCPCCKGNPDKKFEPRSLSDLEFGDDDPAIRIDQLEDRDEGKAPKWERPNDPVLWTCDACGVQVIGNVNYPENSEHYLEYRLPNGAPGTQWYHSHPYYKGSPEKEPTHVFEGGQKVCEFCLDHCHECRRAICTLLDVDTYDDGWGASPEGYSPDLFCIDCVESMCSECGGLPDDCTCEHDDDEN